MKRTLVAAAVSSVILTPAAAPAVDFSVSGHINRMIRFADDGKESDVQFVDNSASRSRVRFVGSSDIGNGMRAGVRLELGFASNRSDPAPGIKGADGGDSFEGADDIRHSALWFQGSWGRAWLGHTSSAADGTGESDLSGTSIADSFTSSLVCGSCEMRASNGKLAGGTVFDFHGTFDGGRHDLLRYDTPAFGPSGGGKLKLSMGNKGRYEVGALYSGDAGPGTLAVSGGYISSEDRDGYDQWQISGSYLLNQGLNLTLFYGDRDVKDGRDSDSFGAKLGYQYGRNAFSLSYQDYSHTAGRGDESDRIGLGWVHKTNSVEFYGGWQLFSTDLKKVDVEDFNSVYVGSRVKFE